MTTRDDSLQMPPQLYTTEGEERRVGVELEMHGLELDQLARVAARKLDLRVVDAGRYERLLCGDAAGDWEVELDFALLKRMGREDREPSSLLTDLGETAETLLAMGAEPLVPVELVSPPLPLHRLPEIESLIEHLREAGALGTSSRLRYAFGMQFNPEVPDTAPETLRDYLRAFLCLHDWLDERAEINFTRRLTSYIDAFPRHYALKVLASTYAPDITGLIRDYLIDNPTRNRALDLLPLFAWLDGNLVARYVQDERVKPRPTFHYRLPNCEIDRPGWGLKQAWHDWLEVEKLATDQDRLNACCRAYQRHLTDLFHLPGSWARTVEMEWLS
ncbi:MAG: amidoligase family protein [Pseudohongiellaceae bacterium]